VFDDAEAGKAVLVLHPLVLAEFYYVLRKEGFEQDAPFYLQYVKEVSGYRLEALTPDDVMQLPN
jgi:predicted nucleic acid-binding protein